MELGESLAETMIREAWDETSLAVEPPYTIGASTRPHRSPALGLLAACTPGESAGSPSRLRAGTGSTQFCPLPTGAVRPWLIVGYCPIIS